MSDAYIAPFLRINHGYDEHGELFQTWATTISRDAVIIRTREPFEPGTRVGLKFAVLLDTPEIIIGEGVVVRVDSRTPMTMEVRFENLTPESYVLIDRLLANGSPR